MTKQDTTPAETADVFATLTGQKAHQALMVLSRLAQCYAPEPNTLALVLFVHEDLGALEIVGVNVDPEDAALILASALECTTRSAGDTPAEGMH